MRNPSTFSPYKHGEWELACGRTSASLSPLCPWPGGHFSYKMEEGTGHSRCSAGRAVAVTACALASCRSQELHLRHESHSYLPELGKSEMEFIESKRPRLELLPDPLLRPSPLLAAGQPGGSEDLCKVRPGPPPGAPLKIWLLLRWSCVPGRGGPEGGRLGGGQTERGVRDALVSGPVLGWRGTAPTRACCPAGTVSLLCTAARQG